MVALCLVLGGCRATLEQPSGDSGSGGSGANEFPNGAGPAPLRLLTAQEYRYSIEDVFGPTPELESLVKEFPAEITGDSGFATVGAVSPLHVRQYMLAGEALAPGMRTKLVERHPCLAGSDPDEACVRQVIEGTGRRLLRHELSSDEVVEFTELFSAERAYSDFDTSFTHLVSGILQSPAFLYRWELDESSLEWDSSAKLVRLSPFQLASRLSYFLWKSVPDEPLLAAAESGVLASADGIRSEALRMLADPKAARTAASFHRQWLHIDTLENLVKNEARFPEFTESLKSAMMRDFEAFASDQLLGGGTIDSLLTAPITTDDPLVATILDADAPGQREGVLTTPAFLAMQAGLNEGNPILRGAVVREQLLCQTLRAPPPGIPTLAELDPNVPMRERLSVHVEEPSCRGCHQLTDPIGFGLGNFDAIGRYQTTDLGAPVDATGTVYGLDGTDVAYVGAAELGRVLAASPTVRGCLTNNWFRYAVGRSEVDSERGELESALTAAESSGGSLRDLLLALVTSRPFAYRAPIPGETP